MLFTSLNFIILLFLTFVVYYLPFFSRFQITILAISSLIFYAYSQPILLFLLLVSVLINIISSYYVTYGKPERKKINAIAGVSLNLFILIFFKYSPLFSRTFLNPKDPIGSFLLTIPLPIGISFFTFQGISLVVDVYKEKYFAAKDVIHRSFWKHAQTILFFKAFFPQLISGPIVKAHDFLPQIGKKNFKDIQWESCFKALLTGYFLKMVIADNLKDQTYWMEFPWFQGMSTITLLSLLWGYSFQIFADFAGYSLIAIGLAKLFGYTLPENFNFPYIATSFSEFWKRWHISLSSFLKEYLYIPLGGNKHGKFRTYFNLMITMILGGLWHGAAWSYAVWGGFHGLALALERFFKDYIHFPSNKIISFFSGLIVFAVVTFAWLLFKLPDFS
ncbi:MAG TPA: MBOAT family O-acyltransferase, partial [Bacteroidia bacterium]|nr:MBOAT family O-acyltransferase [Bacteroidia bacterium]